MKKTDKNPIERKTKRRVSRADEKLLKLTNLVYADPSKRKLTIDEWCLLIAEWLMLHPQSVCVLDFYASGDREQYTPFEYRLEEVIERNHPAIYAVLSERIFDKALRNGLNERIAKMFLGKRNFEEAKRETMICGNGEMTFKFGE